jgi:6-phosphogluconolactonase
MDWVAREDVTAVERVAAEFIAQRLTTAAEERGRAILAISGGSTPWGMFERLASQAVPWTYVHLFQVDERIVPPDHDARNWKRFLENPLSLRIPRANCHAMPVNAEDAELAAAAYSTTLTEYSGEPPVLDVVHLGIGEDGHTASLFNDDALLQERQRWVGVSRRYRNHRRLSLTLPTLNRARLVVWFAVGAGRRAVLTRLRDGDLSIPAGRVQRDRAVVFTDLDAAPATERS